MSSIQKIIAVVGPTASGKTALAISLAKKYNGEIVSADSRQIYRGMDIGTAKVPISSERSEATKSSVLAPSRRGSASGGKARIHAHLSDSVPHYLIDIKNPDEDYSAGDYKCDAIDAINDILKRGKLPILAGGTGLYIKAVIDNLTIPKVKVNPQFRKKLEAQIKKEGLAVVYQKLITLDPEAANIVDPKNPRRVMRALEIVLKTKQPFSVSRKSGPSLFDAVQIGLCPGKDILENRIKKRTKDMLENGLVKEVKGLVKKYGLKCKSFDAIGYREVIDYLGGKTSLIEVENLINKNTISYAKRQMTWFKKDKRIRWAKTMTEALKLSELAPGRFN